MQGFVLNILVKLIADPKVQEFLLQVVERLAALLFPKLAALIPAAVGSAVKTALDELIERTPGISGAVDVVKATEAAASSVEDIIGKLPIIGDLFKGLGFGV